VPAGNVGVKVFLLGSDKGVDTEILTPGRYWIGWNEDLYLFPTFTQNYVWEEMTFQTVEGLSVSGDVGISYQIDPDKVPLIFQKYRKGIDEITDIYLRNQVRDALVVVAGSMKIDDVYGRQKGMIMDKVQQIVNKHVAPLGILIEKIYWVGDLRLPPNVITALNAKIEAIQKTQQRENEVAQSRAEAQKQIEAARGEAESKIVNAKADAEAIRIKGEALRQNPALIELSAIEKWDGKLPVYSGSSVVPFVDVNK
jgi:regulator of protease activity HflC (stomatin/prohibitin superfamily)